jgi:hypothetical protein
MSNKKEEFDQMRRLQQCKRDCTLSFRQASWDDPYYEAYIHHPLEAVLTKAKTATEAVDLALNQLEAVERKLADDKPND